MVHTREQAIDTELLVVLAGTGEQLARRMAPAVRGVTPAELLARLRNLYAGGQAGGGALSSEAFDWAALGVEAGALFTAAPGSGPHLLGALSVDAKERKAAVRRAKDAAAPAVRPEEVGAGGGGIGGTAAGAAQETDRNIKAMSRALRSLPGPVDAFAFVYNGRCFAQTVENVFTLSFLVKDGLARLTRPPGGGGGGVLVSASARPSSEEFSRGEAQLLQFVLRLDAADWAAAAGRMPPQPYIAHREALPAAKAPRRMGAGENGGGDGNGNGGGDAAPQPPRMQTQTQQQQRKRKAAAPRRRAAAAADDGDETGEDEDGGEGEGEERAPAKRAR